MFLCPQLTRLKQIWLGVGGTDSGVGVGVRVGVKVEVGVLRSHPLTIRGKFTVHLRLTPLL